MVRPLSAMQFDKIVGLSPAAACVHALKAVGRQVSGKGSSAHRHSHRCLSCDLLNAPIVDFPNVP